MAQKSKLSAAFVRACREPGKYGDGNNLYLQVSGSGAQSWIFRYMFHRNPHEMGLGSASIFSLYEARQKAHECRRQLAEGFSPLEVRQEERRKRTFEDSKNVSFESCSAQFLAAKSSEWSNLKHKAQWESTLRTYAFPYIGSLPVQSINTSLVLRLLTPIWQSKTETASRLRARIEAVLAYAIVRGWKDGDNPARWRGHLSSILPQPTRVKPVKHMAALPWIDIPEFMKEVRGRKSLSARALELLVLSCVRVGELSAAKKGEFDLIEGIWTIPAERMKKRKIHRVPLTHRGVQVITELSALDSEFVFPGLKGGYKPLTTNSILNLVKSMRPNIDITSHGFRSTFKDWATENTDYPIEVIEMALAHSISNKVEAAYRRGDLFEKRRRLMADWSNFCLSRSYAIPSPAMASSSSKSLDSSFAIESEAYKL